MMTFSSPDDVTRGRQSERPVSANVKQVRTLPSFRLGTKVFMLVMPKDTLKSEKPRNYYVM